MKQTTDTPAHYKFWPPGIPFEIEVENKTLWDSLQTIAASDPNAIGIEFLGKHYTWKELEQEALSMAASLQELGVKPGDRVAMFSQNTPQFAIGFHAAIRCGAVVVPVNPMNKAAEVAYCLANSGAKVAISSADIAAEFALANEQLEEADQLKHLIVFKTVDEDHLELIPDVWKGWLGAQYELPSLSGGEVYAWDSLMAKQGSPSDVNLNPEDLTLLMYTSGTTGHPKACMHSHKSIVANSSQPKIWQDLRKGDAGLIVTPMFHITGLVGGLLAGIDAGSKCVILPRWDRRIAAKSISEQGVTHWINIPTMVIDLLAEPQLDSFDLSSLRFIGGGGAAMPDAVANRLKSEFGLEYIEAYGLTETAAPSHSNPVNAPRFQCLGIPIINTQSCIMDPDTKLEAPTGELGEILIRGPQVFLGYWKNEQATEDSFIEVNGLKWFRSGDLGYVDEDGYYYIADRIKRMINASGFKVWPAEVEGLFYRHPAIQDVCIISKNDPYRGQSVLAKIVLKAGDNKTTAQDITAWARENMSVYKVPRDIDFVEALPKGATGKVLWKTLQAEQDEMDKKSAES